MSSPYIPPRRPVHVHLRALDVGVVDVLALAAVPHGATGYCGRIHSSHGQSVVVHLSEVVRDRASVAQA